MTTVPNKWSILLSQRRRWINSTVHNLFRLLFVRRMCGVCCFSMKFMVFIDLLTTIFLPASCSYLIYLIYAFVSKTEDMNVTFITMTSVIVGVQILIFVIKRDFVYILWLILYLLATPIWMIVLPVYAFAKMDDFSWGNTRKIEKSHLSVISSVGHPFVGDGTSQIRSRHLNSPTNGGPTDGGPTDEKTHSLIEMKQHDVKEKKTSDT